MLDTKQRTADAPLAGQAADLRIGLPKGRFEEQSVAILRALGAAYEPESRKGAFRLNHEGLSLSVKLLKVPDIAKLLALGELDAGITCDEWLVEFGAEVADLADMGWCTTDIVLAGPRHTNGEAPAIGDMRIATPYPRLTRHQLARIGVPRKVLPVAASSEILVPDICDAIVDCVETGSTLRAHDLVVYRNFFVSRTRFVCRPERAGKFPPTLLNAVVDHVSVPDQPQELRRNP